MAAAQHNWSEGGTQLTVTGRSDVDELDLMDDRSTLLHGKA